MLTSPAMITTYFRKSRPRRRVIVAVAIGLPYNFGRAVTPQVHPEGPIGGDGEVPVARGRFPTRDAGQAQVGMRFQGSHPQLGGAGQGVLVPRPGLGPVAAPLPD